jgi:hypothetical protein
MLRVEQVHAIRHLVLAEGLGVRRVAREFGVEEGHEVGVTLVKEYVAEHERRRREVFVPLEYLPGDLGEVDRFEVWVDLAGTLARQNRPASLLIGHRGSW